jgi:hypothetical protein
LQPSAQPDARQITPWLDDFSALWQQMSLTEQRAILQAMFAGLYFDAQNRLRKVLAHNPFDRLLPIR